MPLSPQFLAALNDGPAALAELWNVHELSKEERAALAAKRFVDPNAAENDRTAAEIDRLARAFNQYRDLRRKMGRGAEKRLQRVSDETGILLEKLRYIIGGQGNARVRARARELQTSESNSEVWSDDL